MKKTFIVLQFGKPFSWIEKFINQVEVLGQYGWYWKILTPHKYDNLPSNVEVIHMDINKFNNLVFKKTGIKPVIFITEEGIPSIHITDFMVAYGKIFEDYLKDSIFWGMMGGPDIVFGRLDHFFPDELISKYDIISDDVNTINGCFSLFRNIKPVNELFLKIPDWKEAFSLKICPRCTDLGEKHILFGTDEYGMTNVVRGERIRFFSPKYYPMLSHDRLEQHFPKPKIKVIEDGSLYELFEDKASPKWEHERPFIGREIPYFHFSRTKTWPL